MDHSSDVVTVALAERLAASNVRRNGRKNIVIRDFDNAE